MHYTQAREREEDFLLSISLDRGSVGGKEASRRSPPLLSGSGRINGDICPAVDQKGTPLSVAKDRECTLAWRRRREGRDGWCSAGSAYRPPAPPFPEAVEGEGGGGGPGLVKRLILQEPG